MQRSNAIGWCFTRRARRTWLRCIQGAEKENLAAKRGIRDILIGVPTDEGIPVQIFSEPSNFDDTSATESNQELAG